MNAIGIVALAGCCALGAIEAWQAPYGEVAGARLAPLELELDQAEELGQVQWRRDHEEAFGEARRTKKPLLLLFQEIPG